MATKLIPANPNWVRGVKLWAVMSKLKGVGPRGPIFKSKLIPKGQLPKGVSQVIVLDWLVSCPKCGKVNDLRGYKLSQSFTCSCGQEWTEDERLSYDPLTDQQFTICQSQAHYEQEAGPLRYEAKLPGKGRVVCRDDERQVYNLPTREELEKLGRKSKSPDPEAATEKEVHNLHEKRERIEKNAVRVEKARGWIDRVKKVDALDVLAFAIGIWPEIKLKGGSK